MQDQIDIAWRIRLSRHGVAGPNKCEAMMGTIEKEYLRATLSIRVVEPKDASEDGLFLAHENRADDSAELCSDLFEFAGNAPATLAERFPRLMVCTVAVALILATLTAEIECLRGAGYYW